MQQLPAVPFKIRPTTLACILVGLQLCSSMIHAFGSESFRNRRDHKGAKVCAVVLMHEAEVFLGVRTPRHPEADKLWKCGSSRPGSVVLNRACCFSEILSLVSSLGRCQAEWRRSCRVC